MYEIIDIESLLRVGAYDHKKHNEIKQFDCLLKKDIVESGYAQTWCKIRYAIKYAKEELVLFDKENGTLREPELDYKTAVQLVNNLDKNYLRVCENLRKAYFKRRKLLERRVQFMLECGKVWFCTLTFTEATIKCRDSTIRTWIKNWIRSMNNPLYIANVDFGKRTKRKHYHVVLCYDLDPVEWTKGFFNYKEVKVKNVSALSKYVAKLTLHSLKISNTSHTVIYSKKFKELGV